MDNSRMKPATALIGKILIDPVLIHNVTHILPEQIEPSIERDVWGAMLALAEKDIGINTISIGDELQGKHSNSLSRFLTDALANTPYNADENILADKVLEYHSRREMKRIASKLATAAHDPKANPEAVTAEVAGELLRGGRVQDMLDVDEVAEDADAVVTEWSENPTEPGQVRGISTGSKAVDIILDGLHPGLYVFAGRASMGKTQWGVHMFEHVTRTEPGLYATFENLPYLIHQRMIGPLAGIPYRDVKHGLRPSQLAKWQRVNAAIKERQIKYYNGGASLPLVTAAINRAYHQMGSLGIVVLDNLGHITTGEEKYEERGTVCKAMLRLAQRLGVPIIALHQIGRGVESRTNKRPTMADLRDSGKIEEDVDVIGLLYRDDYYNPDDTETPNVIELAIAKNRLDGHLGVAELWSDKETGGIRDIR